MALICGIDEAGRGPVIGPMVIAGVLIDEQEEYKLVNIGVKDSKQLSPLQRERMFDRIKLAAKDYKIIIIPPKEIDEAVEGEELNLNWLEGMKSVELTNRLKPDIVFIDCPSNNIIAFKQYIKQRLENKNVKIVAEHKADENYPVVSAASILAKVTRDMAVLEIRKQIKHDFGSGYPADPKTARFLEEHYEDYPEIFRKSWESYKRVARKKNQKRILEF